MRRSGEYKVIHTTDNRGIVSAEFPDFDSAEKYAKEHDGTVVRNYHFVTAWDEMKFRAFNVGVVLSVVTVLSVVAWGWIGCLCGAGLI